MTQNSLYGQLRCNCTVSVSNRKFGRGSVGAGVGNSVWGVGKCGGKVKGSEEGEK